VLATFTATDEIVAADGLVLPAPLAALAIEAGVFLGTALVTAETLKADAAAFGFGRFDDEGVIGRADGLPPLPLALPAPADLAVLAALLAALLDRWTAGAVLGAGTVAATIAAAFLPLRALGADARASHASRAPGSAGVGEPGPLGVRARCVGVTDALPVLADAALSALHPFSLGMTLRVPAGGHPAGHPDPEAAKGDIDGDAAHLKYE
jgi:hypothetical protein